MMDRPAIEVDRASEHGAGGCPPARRARELGRRFRRQHKTDALQRADTAPRSLTARRAEWRSVPGSSEPRRTIPRPPVTVEQAALKRRSAA